MRTPEEIKKGLECCSKNDPYPCSGCPYERDELIADAWRCNLNADALSYIQQLEHERNALVRDLCNADQNNCEFCKHRRDAVAEEMCEDSDYMCGDCERDDCPCKMCAGGSNWEWRGVTDRS